MRFVLVDGGLYPLLFWAGFVVVGSALPLLLLFHPRLASARNTLAASMLVIAGWRAGRSSRPNSGCGRVGGGKCAPSPGGFRASRRTALGR